MKDSAANSPEAPATPIERPSWRFSGRRGTPVHLRERTPANLPPEIRQAVAQMTREQASGQAPTGEGTPGAPRAAATSTLNLGGGERQSPPVAGAPMPVERRTRSEQPEQPVTTTPLEAVPAPAPQPEPVDTTPPPLDEPVVVADVTAPEPATRDASTSEVEASEVETPEVTAEPDPDAKPAAATREKRQPSPAERRKRAKARAKARAKSQKDPDGKRRLFAKGREVDAATEPVAVEPTPPTPTPVVEPEPVATAEPVVEPILDTAPATPAAEVVVEPELEPEVEPEVVADVVPAQPEPTEPEPSPEPAPEPVAAIEDVDLGSSTPVGAVASSRPTPAPVAASETASQAAWELGRLPILLAPTSTAAAPPPIDEQPEPELVIPAADSARRMPAMDWQPVGASPSPAPIEPSTPRTPVPSEIARLEASLYVPAERRPRVASSQDVAAARQRIARRRRELEETVASLGELADRVAH